MNERFVNEVGEIPVWRATIKDTATPAQLGMRMKTTAVSSSGQECLLNREPAALLQDWGEYILN